MPRASERTAERRDFWLVAACVLFSVGALFAPPSTGVAIADLLRRSVLAPLVYIQSIAVEGRQTRSRFAGVSAERDSARLSAQQLPRLKAENDDLRALLGFSRRLTRKWRPAEVLHQQQPTDGRMLLINVGKRDGIAEFAPVVSAGGLIGVVRTVGPSASTVLTWAHPDWRASATTADGKAYGMVSVSAAPSAGEAALEFHAISFRDSLPAGTLIVTAGLGGVYPPGIPLGTIEGIASEQTGWERTYRVHPAASPSGSTHLLVLDANGTGSMASAFPQDTVVAPPKAPASGPADSTAAPAVAPRDSSARPAAAPNDSAKPARRRKPDTTSTGVPVPVPPATPDSAT